MLPQLSGQEGGVSRILVTDLFDAPCQAEETDQGPQLIIEQIKNCLKLLMNFCQGSSLQSSTNYRANKNSLKLVKEHPSKNSLKSVKERQSKEVEQQYNF